MFYSAISRNLEEVYPVPICKGAISKITDQLLAEIEEWKNRPSERVYSLLFLDAMHFKMREYGYIVSKDSYSLLAIKNIMNKVAKKPHIK